MNGVVLAALAGDAIAARPTRVEALRAALAAVRAEAPKGGRAFAAIVDRHLAGCASDDEIESAWTGIDNGYVAIWDRTSPPTWSLARGIVALERAIDSSGDDAAWCARLRVVERELAKEKADATHARVAERMAERGNQIAALKLGA